MKAGNGISGLNLGVEAMNRRLMRNLALMVLAALVTGVVVYLDKQLVRTLSVDLIHQIQTT